MLATALAVSTVASGQWTPCRHFGVREGLAQSQVTDLAQDSNGFLWIATQGGISRFDGRRFSVFTTADGLPDNVVTSLATAGDTVWVATDLGLLAVWDGGRFTPVDGPVPGRRIPIRSLAVRSDGTLLVATADGLFEGRPGAFVKVLDEPVRRLVKLDDGTVWVLAKRVFKVLPSGDVEEVDLPGAPGEVAGVVRLGRTGWIVWDSGTIVRTTPTGMEHTRLPLRRKVTDLAGDPQGGLLIATEGGLWKRSPDGELSAVRVTLQQRPVNVHRLFIDRESNLWIGTFGEGLIQRPPSPFTQFTLETGLPATMVWSFSENAAGCIQMGTADAGVVSWCGDHWGPSLTTRDGLPSNTVLTLGRDAAGRLWIGTRAGICRLSHGRCTTWTVRDGLPSNDVRGIASDGHGGVWLATSAGLAHWNGKGWTSYTRMADLESPLLRSIVVDTHGAVWASVNANGIIRFDGRRFQHFGLEDGLPTLRVWTLMADPEGRIWASTDEGIWIRSPDGRSSRVLVRGLPTPIVIFLVRDEDGMVWAGTTRGIVRISPEGKVIQRFTAEDGLSDSEAAEGAAFRDSTGKLWFGMAYGVTRVDTRLLLRNSVPPIAVLERLLVNGTVPPAFHPLSSNQRSRPAPLVLGTAPLDLRFDFVAASLTAPAEVRYRYQLEGFDPDPTGPVAEDYAKYHRVPDGRYRFVLEAANNDGVWSRPPLVMDLIIVPPWYATPWFRGLVVLLLVGSTILIVRVRFQAQRRRQRALEAEVRQRTADLAEANRRIREQNELLLELSRTDPLTGLGNRRVLAEHLPLELAILRREILRERPASLDAYHGAMVAMLDLDHFKRINDRWGHDVGDRVLQAVARTLEPVLREGDLGIRWGGEEFVILSRGIDTSGAIRLARRILHRVGATSVEAQDGSRIRLRASLGFIQLPLGTGAFLEAALWTRFVEAADRLLYEAKTRGRYRACGAVWRNGASGPVAEQELLEDLLRNPASPPPPLRFVEIPGDEEPGE